MRIAHLRQNYFKNWIQLDTTSNNISMGIVLAPFGPDKRMALDEPNITKDVIDRRILDYLPDWEINSHSAPQCYNFLHYKGFVVVIPHRDSTIRYIVLLSSPVFWNESADKGSGGKGAFCRKITSVCTVNKNELRLRGGQLQSTFLEYSKTTTTYKLISQFIRSDDMAGIGADVDDGARDMCQ